MAETRDMLPLPLDEGDEFGCWCDEGGKYIVFSSERGNLVGRLYDVLGPAQNVEVAKFTLSSFRAHVFWRWYNHVAPLPKEIEAARDG